MSTLTLEHLAPYLPYGLKGNCSGLSRDPYGENTPIQVTLVGLNKEWVEVQADSDDYDYHINDFFPLLRPLSDLTKEIEHNGEKFVPLIRLLEYNQRFHFAKDNMKHTCAKLKVNVISCETINYEMLKKTEYVVKHVVSTSNMGDLVYSFTYQPDYDRFVARDESNQRMIGVGYHLQLFQTLFSWHFDVFGLIEQGLAIDINKLKS
jgi:hypothetical protein